MSAFDVNFAVLAGKTEVVLAVIATVLLSGRMQICTNIPHVQVVTMALDMFPFWCVTVDDLQVLIKVQVQFTGFAHIDNHAEIVAILETRVKILCWHPKMWTDAKQVVKQKLFLACFMVQILTTLGARAGNRLPSRGRHCVLMHSQADGCIFSKHKTGRSSRWLEMLSNVPPMSDCFCNVWNALPGKVGGQHGCHRVQQCR
jgi:hypothetical protein